MARAIAAGSTQASQRTLASSIRTLEVADEIRWRLGVVFPGDAVIPGETTPSRDTRRN